MPTSCRTCRWKRRSSEADISEGAPVTEVIAGYLDHLTVERGAGQNTLRSYERDLRRYARYLRQQGVLDLGTVTETEISGFLRWLRTEDPDHHALAATSAARAVVAVRGLHRFALREGLTPTNAASAVAPPQAPQRLPKALGVAEVLRLLEACGQGESAAAVRDRALLELLYSTGARISELVGMDVDDLDTTARTALLLGKGSKQRLVPVGRPALHALESYLVRVRPAMAARARAGGASHALLLNSRGGRLSRQSAWQALKSAARRAGLAETVSPHTLRHSFATHMLEGGADVRVVQELLGHASVTTTQIYTRITVDTLREVYATAHPRAVHG